MSDRPPAPWAVPNNGLGLWGAPETPEAPAGSPQHAADVLENWRRAYEHQAEEHRKELRRRDNIIVVLGVIVFFWLVSLGHDASAPGCAVDPEGCAPTETAPY